MANMAGFNEATVEEIKNRVDLADLIASYGIRVKTAGSSKKACCPFHNEKTPSFHINDAKGFYHCFGCGESGDAIRFVQKMDGLTFAEAVKKLAEQCGIAIEEKRDPAAAKRKRLLSLLAELAQFYHRCLIRTREAAPAREYLEKRALGPEVQESFLIGYAPNGISTILKWAEKYGYSSDELAEAGVIKLPQGPSDRGYHRFGGRLMFSVTDKRGRVVAFSGRQLAANRNSGKYVNSPETAVFKKSSVLFGFDKASGNIVKSPLREAIVCEGQIDTIRLHISGFPVAVASQGTAFTEEHVAMLKKSADQVLLVFDDDAAGRKATIRTARLFLAAEMPVRVVSLPGGDDPDSYLRAHPKEDFQRLIDGAESIVSYQVRVESEKEANPGAVDAVARITRSVLETVAASRNAVVRAGMAAEAAKLLSLPAAAVGEELEKIRLRTPASPRARAAVPDEPDFTGDCADGSGGFADEVPDDGDLAGFAGMDAGAASPPPAAETAFCEFLLANEYDKTLAEMIAGYLPPEVFQHDFTRRFVEVWSKESARGEDMFGEFATALAEPERGWFDRLLVGSGKTEASSLSPADILKDFIRRLWSEKLKRRRGTLPCIGEEADLERMRISMALKRLAQVKWHTVKEMIGEWRDLV
jgi:DNA primase